MLRVAGCLTELCTASGRRLSCVSLTDSIARLERHSNPVSYGTFFGARSSKVRFLAQVAWLAATEAQGLAVVGHVNLAPVAYLLKRLGLIRYYVLILLGMEAWIPASAGVRRACRNADFVVATTKYPAREFQLHNGFAHPNIPVIPLALGERMVASPKQHSGNAFNTLTVTRLAESDRYKGTDHLIAAVGALNRQGVPARLRVVGSGGYRSQLEAHAKESGAGAVVSFTGGVSARELSTLYSDSDVFALPSQKEGFGLVFLEAMRHGKPCLGGRHGGTLEVIREGMDAKQTLVSLESRFYLRSQLLRDIDWASMAHSLEVRTPSVDAILLREIVSHAERFGWPTKALMADCPQLALPAELVGRPKTGFALPMSHSKSRPRVIGEPPQRTWARDMYYRYCLDVKEAPRSVPAPAPSMALSEA